MKREMVICIKNTGYEASLEKRKIYFKIKDPIADSHRQIRVIDESGEDYLFPTEFFIPVELPVKLEKALLSAA